MKDKHRRLWLSVIIGDELLVSHAGGALLVEAARRSGLAKELLAGLAPWRRLVATLAEDVDAALVAISGARAAARQRIWVWTGAPARTTEW